MFLAFLLIVAFLALFFSLNLFALLFNFLIIFFLQLRGHLGSGQHCKDREKIKKTEYQSVSQGGGMLPAVCVCAKMALCACVSILLSVYLYFPHTDFQLSWMFYLFVQD